MHKIHLPLRDFSSSLDNVQVHEKQESSAYVCIYLLDTKYMCLHLKLVIPPLTGEDQVLMDDDVPG